MNPIAADRASHRGVSVETVHIVRLVAGTIVLTLDGALPVEHLTAGDRIVTRAGSRRLTDVTGTSVDNADLVRIGAGTLGHDRPAGPVLVPADQLVLVRDWRAKALYGVSQAVVPVSRLVDGTLIARVRVRQARVYTLMFDTPVILTTDGLEPASMPAHAPIAA